MAQRSWVMLRHKPAWACSSSGYRWHKCWGGNLMPEIANFLLSKTCLSFFLSVPHLLAKWFTELCSLASFWLLCVHICIFDLQQTKLSFCSSYPAGFVTTPLSLSCPHCCLFPLVGVQVVCGCRQRSLDDPKFETNVFPRIFWNTWLSFY